PYSVRLSEDIWSFSFLGNDEKRKRIQTILKTGVIKLDGSKHFHCAHYSYYGGSTCNTTKIYLWPVNGGLKLELNENSINELTSQLKNLSLTETSADLLDGLRKKIADTKLYSDVWLYGGIRVSFQ
ncbi:unnamed protein product, partial [Didymodactylos carnosus]